MKIRDLLNQGLRLAGVIQNNETASAEDLALSQEVLSNIYDMWSTNPQMNWTKRKYGGSVNAGATTYTFSTRPARVHDVQYSYTNTGNDLNYKLNEWDFQDVINSSLKLSGPPTKYAWNGEMYLTLDRAPSQLIYLNVVVSEPLIDDSTSLDTVISLPPGYATALKYNLGLLLSEEFGKQPSPVLQALAQESYNALKSQNRRPSITKPEVGRMFGNIRNYDVSGYVR